MPVPHFYQSSPQTCGAACLRMLFAMLGTSHAEATIAQACGMTALGCTVQDLAQGARSLGFNAAVMHLPDEPAAKSALSSEAPFVAMIDLAGLDPLQPMLTWHFVVPLALAGDEVLFHDPAERPARRMKLDLFLNAWARRHTWECVYGPRNTSPGFPSGQRRPHDSTREPVLRPGNTALVRSDSLSDGGRGGRDWRRGTGPRRADSLRSEPARVGNPCHPVAPGSGTIRPALMEQHAGVIDAAEERSRAGGRIR